MAKKIITPKTPALNLISKVPYLHTDSNLNLALEALKPATILKRMGFKKRSGDPIEAVLYTLLLLPLLRIRTICTFFEHQLSTLLEGGKDVIYGLMENQSVNWSLLTMKLAFRFFNLRKRNRIIDGPTAFVADDTLDERFGKKVEATSLHWDHNKGKSIKGHPFLQLGLANSDGILLLIGHIYRKKKEAFETVQSVP